MSSLNLDTTRFNQEVSHGPIPRRHLRLVGPRPVVPAPVVRPGPAVSGRGLTRGERWLLWYSLACAGLLAAALVAALMEGWR